VVLVVMVMTINSDDDDDQMVVVRVHGLVVCVHVVLKAISDNRPPAWLAHMYTPMMVYTIHGPKLTSVPKN
jgi:hypothetical protein